MLCSEYNRSSAIKEIDYEMVQQMMPQSFQEQLHSKHIIIADYNLLDL